MFEGKANELDKRTCLEAIKDANIEELKEYAFKIRTRIVETVQKNGGHLSSNLGTVELTLALYR
ncbi:MAG: 1-deoxy-D-xylulose-5-phosphate synthase N-terminal domain-containing protein, partial [Bacteroidota bacterium]